MPKFIDMMVRSMILYLALEMLKTTLAIMIVQMLNLSRRK